MIASHPANPHRPGRLLLVSLASTALLAAGCSSLVSTAPSSGLPSSAATLGGRVHGGNQPVSLATVNLYFAGQGSASKTTLVATTKTSADGTGSFAFTKLADGVPNTGLTNSFSCPLPTAGASPLVYVIARGGNTLNDGDLTKNNTAAVFIAPVGICANINSSTFTYMSEAVTAATVAAVHQFMNVSTSEISADSILSAYDALQNAFGTVSNLASLTTGQTLASSSKIGDVPGVTVTVTPEQAKLNQIANILSACVNNASSTAAACTTLFANAVPPGNASTTSTPNATFPPATDVLQAAYYIFTNPTNLNSANLTRLYNLAPATGAPYQPTLTAVPSDWTIGVQYIASGTCGPTGGQFISNPYDINVEETGNIWISNAQTGGSSLSQLSPLGKPLFCIPIAGSSRGGTIDVTGKVWVGDYQNATITRYDPVSKTSLVFPTTTAPFALASDGNGNIYYSTMTAPSVWMIPGGATATAAVAPVQISTAVGATPSRILVDGKGAIWASTRNTYVSQITPAAAGSPNFLNGYTTTQVTTPSPSYGIAANSGVNSPNSIYVSIQDPANQIERLDGAGTSYGPGFLTVSGAGGLNSPNAIALDGSSNVWSTNDQPNTTTPPTSLVTEISGSGASLSPDGNTAGGFQKASSYFVNGRVIAIDQAGNVWVGRDGSAQVTQVVGGAVPVFQPFSLGLKQGRFMTQP